MAKAHFILLKLVAIFAPNTQRTLLCQIQPNSTGTVSKLAKYLRGELCNQYMAVIELTLSCMKLEALSSLFWSMKEKNLSMRASPMGPMPSTTFCSSTVSITGSRLFRSNHAPLCSMYTVLLKSVTRNISRPKSVYSAV